MNRDLKIGTSGFQYPEWKGKFYPDSLPLAKMLPYYAEHFSTTEINYTFRTIPSSATLGKWAGLTPEHFVFSLKALQKITHFARLKNCEELVTAFFNAASLLKEKLGPILFQIPPNFKKDAPLLGDFLAILPDDCRAAFEFRHDSWFDDEVFALLHQRNAALCIAESADLATPFQATASFGYLRLRREDYTKPDIKKWAGQIATSSWKQTFVYFKHEETGVGPRFATELIALLTSGKRPNH